MIETDLIGTKVFTKETEETASVGVIRAVYLKPIGGTSELTFLVEVFSKKSTYKVLIEYPAVGITIAR